MLTVGLVVEGPHDLIMLEPVIGRQIKLSHGADVRFRRLQPFPDAIGNFSSGGWPRVLAWCKNNSGSGIETYFEPLFAADPPCDVIIIHLDGDVMEHLHPHTKTKIPASQVAPIDRVEIIHKALEEWLDLAEDNRAKIAFAVPVLQSEAWILAAEGSVANVENINAKDEFRKSWSHKADGPLGAYYLKRTLGVKDSLSAISASCSGFACFENSIRSLKVA